MFGDNAVAILYDALGFSAITTTLPFRDHIDGVTKHLPHHQCY
ncbi:MAG: hypothetical protein QXM54_00225 [Desulfurococcaceae archaeon]